MCPRPQKGGPGGHIRQREDASGAAVPGFLRRQEPCCGTRGRGGPSGPGVAGRRLRSWRVPNPPLGRPARLCGRKSLPHRSAPTRSCVRSWRGGGTLCRPSLWNTIKGSPVTADLPGLSHRLRKPRAHTAAHGGAVCRGLCPPSHRRVLQLNVSSVLTGRCSNALFSNIVYSRFHLV